MDEPLAVAERRRGRELFAVARLDESPVPAAERRKRPEEPGVAEKRCGFQRLGRDECRSRRAGAFGDHGQREPLGRRQPVPG